jgi:hypothetical protein
MGESVLEIHELSKDGILNDYDVNYFCLKVGIDQKSSTFRKYKAIGENASKFRESIKKLPSAFSTLYEIATFDAYQFERIIINSENTEGLTLKQVKQLANRTTVPSKNSSNTQSPTYINPVSLAKLIKKINKFVIYVSSNAKESQINLLINTLDDLQNNGVLRFDMPEITQYLNDNDDDRQLKLAA